MDEEVRVLEQIPDKADITSYVKIKLGLVQNEEPQPDSPEVLHVCHLMAQMSNGKGIRKLPHSLWY